MITPWGKGCEAGKAYYAAFQAWRDAEPKGKRPERPVNPYPLGSSKRSGSYQWQAGYNWAIADCERQERLARIKGRITNLGEQGK